jgi:hypothetical protein
MIEYDPQKSKCTPFLSAFFIMYIQTPLVFSPTQVSPIHCSSPSAIKKLKQASPPPSNCTNKASHPSQSANQPVGRERIEYPALQQSLAWPAASEKIWRENSVWDVHFVYAICFQLRLVNHLGFPSLVVGDKKEERPPNACHSIMTDFLKWREKSHIIRASNALFHVDSEN